MTTACRLPDITDAVCERTVCEQHRDGGIYAACLLSLEYQSRKRKGKCNAVLCGCVSYTNSTARRLIYTGTHSFALNHCGTLALVRVSVEMYSVYCVVLYDAGWCDGMVAGAVLLLFVL